MTVPDPVWHPEGLHMFDVGREAQEDRDEIVSRVARPMGNLLQAAAGFCKIGLCKVRIPPPPQVRNIPHTGRLFRDPCSLSTVFPKEHFLVLHLYLDGTQMPKSLPSPNVAKPGTAVGEKMKSTLAGYHKTPYLSWTSKSAPPPSQSALLNTLLHSLNIHWPSW